MARETRDIEKAKQVCAQDLCAYEVSLQPEILARREGIEMKSAKKDALCHQLYATPDEPVSDKAMLSRARTIKVLIGVLAVVVAVSVAAQTWRLMLFGIGAIPAFIGALIATGFAAGLGFLAFDRLLNGKKQIQAGVIAVAACLMVLGMFQFNRASSIAVAHRESTAQTTNSYVDGADAEPQPASETQPETGQQEAERLLKNALTNIFLSADLTIGLLLGIVVLMRNDDKYVTWKHIARLEEEIERLKWEMAHVLGMLEIAQRECAAGILRFFHTQRPQPPSYFKPGLGCLLIVLIGSGVARAQNVTRQEAILIDVSGSIGASGANNELFREYMKGVRELLLTEPPNSRVVVSLITAESFGSTRELLKAWTPAARGVFTDDLNRARQQLAAAFETKTAGVQPIAAGTDLIGGLWRMKALLESGSASGARVEHEIWIFSDMINETPALPMPALLAGGPERMLEHAKANGLVVPLSGYKIRVIGASTRGLSPETWNTIKDFWTLYSHAAGAELLTYSTESSPER